MKNRPSTARPAAWAGLLCAWALSICMASAAMAAAKAAPSVDPNELSTVGFKVLVATTPVQQEWLKSLPAGIIRKMQRNGRKYFIYPDAAKSQVYVGGPKEYDAYRKLHPEDTQAANKAASTERAARLKQEDAMRSATARDASDPYLGYSWADFGY